jgi:hypothetical protein
VDRDVRSPGWGLTTLFAILAFGFIAFAVAALVARGQVGGGIFLLAVAGFFAAGAWYLSPSRLAKVSSRRSDGTRTH